MSVDIIRPSPDVVFVLTPLPLLLAIEWILEFELHLLIGMLLNELYDFIDVMDIDSLTVNGDVLDLLEGDDGALSDLRPNRVNDLSGDLTSGAIMVFVSMTKVSSNASLILCGHWRLLELLRRRLILPVDDPDGDDNLDDDDGELTLSKLSAIC